jgi:hypothetical protein
MSQCGLIGELKPYIADFGIVHCREKRKRHGLSKPTHQHCEMV